MFKPVLPGGKRYPTHVHQQSSAGSAAAAAFVAVAKAHLSMLKTAAGSQSTDSLGFLFCAIDCILHNMGAVQIREATTHSVSAHTQRPMLNMTIDGCGGTLQYQWSPTQPSAAHL